MSDTENPITILIPSHYDKSEHVMPDKGKGCPLDPDGHGQGPSCESSSSACGGYFGTVIMNGKQYTRCLYYDEAKKQRKSTELESKWYVLEWEDRQILVMQLKSKTENNHKKLWLLDSDGWLYLPQLNNEKEVPYPYPERFGKLLAIFDDIAVPEVFAAKMEALVGPLKKRRIILCPIVKG